MSRLQFSVIVPVRQAKETIGQTMESLLKQCTGLPVEVIVAVSEDEPLSVHLEHPVKVIKVRAPAGVPQLRLEAALAARGEYLVITEDHCTFPDNWLVALGEAATANPGSVCGGPVANGRDSVVGWAQYLTRYSAFLPVGPDRTAGNLPGNNACYPRELVRGRLKGLKAGFWEAEFNGELAHCGVRFLLLGRLAVTQHQHRGAGSYAVLRFRHGRCYGARRYASVPAKQKVNLLLSCPLIPAVLYGRILRAVMRARWNRLNFAAATPLILLYVLAWSLGEVTGYLTGAGQSCTNTD